MEDSAVPNAPLAVSRRDWLAGAVLACWLAGCDAWRGEPVSVAAHPWVGYAPMFLARGLGWLNDAGVDLVQTPHALASLDALSQGRVQAAALTFDEMLTARAQGLPLTAVLVFNESLGADMVLGRSRMTKLADLRGRRLGYEASSVAEVMLAEVLRVSGLQRSDLILVHLMGDQQVQAWQASDVDAVITYEPIASRLLALGARRLLDTRAMPHTIIDVLAANPQALTGAKAQAMRRLISAHLRAVRHWMVNPQDAAYRMADFLGVPAETVMAASQGLLIPNGPANHRWLAPQTADLAVLASRLMAVLPQARPPAYMEQLGAIWSNALLPPLDDLMEAS